MKTELDVICVNECRPRFTHLQESSLFCDTHDGSVIDDIIADELSLEMQIVNYFGPDYVPDFNIFMEGYSNGIYR